MTMRVGIDMISAGSGFGPAAGGMMSYYDGLLSALCEDPRVDSIVAFASPWNDGLAIPDDPRVETVVCRGLPRNRVGRVVYEQLAFPAIVRHARVDAMLFTCNVKPLLSRRPNAVVLQSLQHFLLPGGAGGLRGAYLKWSVPRSLRGTDVVIAVTQAESSDAIRLFGLDPERIAVVYHGMSNWARSVMEGSVSIPTPTRWDGRPYVLIVSRLYEFKNHRRLIEAFAKLIQNELVPHALVIVGGDADVTSSELKALGEGFGLDNRLHCLGPVPQQDIASLFAGADAVAYVSLYETFGHPVLEALACGKPLVTSSTGATAEVAGGAARLVDPYDVESITSGLRDVLLDEELRGQLAEAGPYRAAEFTWRRCAEGTLRALEHAVRAHATVTERGL